MPENFFPKLITFSQNHYLLATAFVVLLVLWMMHEIRRGAKSISVHDLSRMVNASEALVVDIRPQKDFDQGRIPGALNIPYASLKTRIHELNKQRSKTLILVDDFGQHTGAASRDLQKEKFAVVRLKGGISSWRAESLPLVTT